jgi:hypothetical protein
MRFTIRDVFWLTVVVGLAVLLSLERLDNKRLRRQITDYTERVTRFTFSLQYAQTANKFFQGEEVEKLLKSPTEK